MRHHHETDEERPFQFTLVSAERLLYQGPVRQLAAPGVEGELGILPGHSPLLSRLRPGELRITTPDGETEYLYVSGGMLEVQPFGVTVLADTAERAEEIDARAAEAARERAQVALREATSLMDLAQAQRELAEAIARLRTREHAQRRQRRREKPRFEPARGARQD